MTSPPPFLRHAPFLVVALGVALIGGCELRAQDVAEGNARDRDGDIVITAPPASANCVDQSADGERRLALACLNRRLNSNPEPTRSARADPAAIAGRQPPSRTGTFSRSATAQRMGNAFGKSARPQRPSPPVFAPPVRGRQ